MSLRFILILSHLRLGLPKSLYSVGLSVKILKTLLTPSILATSPAHLNLPDLITTVQTMKSLLRSLLHSPFSSLLGPNIPFWILFSNTLSLHYSLNVRDHGSEPYSTIGNIIAINNSIFKKLIKSVVYSFQGSQAGQVDFIN